uniref:NADH-ubiquinone oxidoreductase chain 6 n=1 Tax=Myrmecocephalus concinnus TaxID=1143072 RepID=A0A0S2M7W0_9COLE|nr:NADH dehydrogenase subunit 6 [Myrmecocephalus concinnus]ALO70721.1 NADH deshydrogenase subunit 6 [Myrmecocephalus concinnus]
MIMTLLSMILSCMFLFLNHPMTLGMNLLLQTIMVSLMTGFFSKNFWFSYILFLIMIGGLLVLFIYMTSIASNEQFTFSSNLLFFLFLLILIMITMLMILDPYINMFHMNHMNFFHFKQLNFSLIKFLNYPSISIILFMIIYLFITLIAIVKITKIEYGPLRQKF